MTDRTTAAACPSCAACSGGSCGTGTRIPWIRWIAGAALLLSAVLFDPVPPVRPALLLGAYLVLGYRIWWQAFRNVTRGHPLDENALMAIATAAAFVIGEYAEAVAVVIFYQVGELLQERAAAGSRRAVRALTEMQPKQVRMLDGGREQYAAPDTVPPGAVIRVLPGERIALDGVVEEGISAVDTAALTGESLPVLVQPGAEVAGGSVNGGGMLRIRVTRAYEDSSVARILHLVEEASAKKARVEKWISRFARIYTPVMVGLAAALALLPPLLTGQPFDVWLYRAAMLLVISCPCALLLSVPLGYFAGIGAAARRGVLIKGGQYLEVLERVGTIAFDKTGTLTDGKLEVVGIRAVVPGAAGRAALLADAAFVEQHSTHPVARAIVRQAALEGLLADASGVQVEEVPGRGLRSVSGDTTVLCGTRAWLEEQGISSLPVQEDGEEGTGTSVWVAAGSRYAGQILLEDRARDDAADAVRQLRRMGVRHMVLLTGDREPVARRIMEDLGLDAVRSRLLPEGKVAAMKELLAQDPLRRKGRVLYVGDGINDAPVLALADAGIAMGARGSDAAVESADIVVRADRLDRIADAMKIARKTGRIIRQNIGLALGVKVMVVALAALGLGTIWQAVIADVGVALLAVGNSWRITRH